MQEVTKWDVEYRQPNHVYLMDGDKIYAYSRWGESKPEYFDRPTTIDRRRRKFVEVANRWKFKMVKPEQPQGRVWNITGSKGDVYTVNENQGSWTCTCSGFKFRGQCRHITTLQLDSVD